MITLNKLYLLLAILVVSVQGQIPSEPVRLSEEKEAWLNRDSSKALQLLLQKTESGSVSHIDFYNLGYLYYLTDDFVQAQLFLRKSLALKPDFVYPCYILAKMMEEKDNLTGARDQLETGLKKDDENYFLRLEYGRVLQKSGRLDQAQEVFENLLDDYENKIEVRVGLANIYRLQKKYKQAAGVLAKELANNPESTVMIERANIFRAMGDDKAASDILLQILREYPNSPELMTYKDTLAVVYNIESIPAPVPLPKYKFTIQPDETVDYKVTYSFMNLGWVKIRMRPVETVLNKTVYPVTFYVDSNPTFNFLISIHHIYESYIDTETMNAIQSRLYTPGSDDYLVRTYWFDYDHGKFYAFIIFADGRYHFVEKYLPRRTQDSTSMLYFARGVVSNNSNGTITVVIDEEYKFGYITYLNEKEKITFGKQEADAVKIFARADFQGVAGMNGDAWGWFLPQDSYLPLQGKFTIIVGSIYITLDKDSGD
jgi:tetratricopeptide (TPR) repeat protein